MCRAHDLREESEWKTHVPRACPHPLPTAHASSPGRTCSYHRTGSHPQSYPRPPPALRLPTTLPLSEQHEGPFPRIGEPAGVALAGECAGGVGVGAGGGNKGELGGGGGVRRQAVGAPGRTHTNSADLCRRVSVWGVEGVSGTRRRGWSRMGLPVGPPGGTHFGFCPVEMGHPHQPTPSGVGRPQP